jgi:SAM-dependent methyltransferase
LTSGFGLKEFVAANLPPAPARVLEVGCGRGELALAMDAIGHDVLAIDPEAPEGDLFRRVSLEELDDPGPFDAIVASRSLHHVPDLAGALDKIARLLRPGGVVILNEHAWDRMDEATARWFLDRWSAADPDAPRSLEEFREYWRADHEGLHTYVAMREQLDHRFAERYFAWTPYMHGELAGAVSEDEIAELVGAGTIRATGFRYAGVRLDQPVPG